MAFITGLLLIDAPASALNNLGQDEGARTENAVATKFIRTRLGAFPYVSAQAFRYWLRTTLEANSNTITNGQLHWKAAPVFREQKVAYTDGNPIEYWDDDLFGYMRAQSKRTGAAEARKADQTRVSETPTATEITRASPFRVSTLVSIAPVQLVQDFGTMSRFEGNPVPHEHQFYRTVLKGLISLDLHAAGTFSYRQRTGFLNLDEHRRKIAEERRLLHLEQEQSYRLPHAERTARVATLLRGLALLSGGAKQALHYTDVTPAVVLAMVTRGGNNPLQYVIVADNQGLPAAHTEALREMVEVWGDQILSPLYVGWVQGFHDAQRNHFLEALEDLQRAGQLPHGYRTGHPRRVLEELAQQIEAQPEPGWLA
jgi:CRISPR-associated protein Cst2